MSEDTRRLLRWVSLLVLLLLALPGQLPAADRARESFPLKPGNSWTYRGTMKTGPGGEEPIVECEVDVRVLVTEVRRWEEGAYFALLVRTSTPLGGGRCEEGDAPCSTTFAYFVDGNTVYEVHGGMVDRLTSGEESDEVSLAEARACVMEASPSFIFPLKDGLRFGSPGWESSPGDLHKWVVSRAEPETVAGTRWEEVYFLRYLSLADDVEVRFVPGIGIVRERYRHHGTIIEHDLRLIDYQLE